MDETRRIQSEEELNHQLQQSIVTRNRNRDIDTEAQVNSATVELSAMNMETNENDWEELDIYSHYHTSAESFDRIIGIIEDVIMNPEFQTLHNSQLEACYQYVSTESVSPTPTGIFELFKEYSQVVAHYIEHEIKKVLPDFDLEGFVSELQSRHDIDSDIYELVSSLTDCKKFQEVIDDYKNMKEGRQIDLSSGITVTQIQG